MPLPGDVGSEAIREKERSSRSAQMGRPVWPEGKPFYILRIQGIFQGQRGLDWQTGKLPAAGEGGIQTPREAMKNQPRRLFFLISASLLLSLTPHIYLDEKE